MAEGERLRRRLKEEGKCPICRNYFTDPVTLNCGHNFCSTCIKKANNFPTRSPDCPLCRQKVQRKKLKPNIQLGNMVEIAQDMSNLLKHRGVLSMEEADQEFAKDQLNRALRILRNEKDNILVNKKESEEDHKQQHEYIELHKDMTRVAFRQLHEFLEEEEQIVLAQKQEVAEEVARRTEEQLTILSGELSSLDSLIQEVEEKQQQSGSQLLQTSGNILESCKNKKPFEKPVVFPIALMWRIHDSYDITPFLEGIMKMFEDNLVSELQLQEANVSLDPDTAHPSLILSEDCKSVRCKGEHQDLPNNPKRFEQMPYVLGQKGFKSGRHFWDVAVGGEEQWTVGVAKESLNRKSDEEEGIYGIGMWSGEYRIILPFISQFSQQTPALSIREDLKMVRVTVNYPGRRVAFLDGDTGAPLVLCTNLPFDGETILPSFNVAKRGHLTLCPQTEDSRE